MNRELALKVANAMLYEGYMLYPYRPSAFKNRQRWSFGILYPPAYHEVAAGTERAQMHSEVLVKVALTSPSLAPKDGDTSGAPAVHVQLRFLQLLEGDHGEEGKERSFACEIPVESAGRACPFQFSTENDTGERREITGSIAAAMTELHDNVFRLSIDVTNTSSLTGDSHNRDSALLSSLLSAHTILTITGGEFVSLLDPPEDLRDAVDVHCNNVGNFPVLVGTEGDRDMMLCSPIVLYDYPQIAPESAGDFFDGTEMDEMLTLRMMTLTDDEKAEVLNANDHVRSLLQRTEASAREQLMRTHGTIRSLRPADDNP